MTNDRLEADLLALAATIDDPSEAEALRELFALAGELPFDEDTGEEYTPFVYPH